jgi:hypothetical protein
LNLNLDISKNGVSIKENWSLKKNNFTFGFLSKFGLGTDTTRSTDVLITHKCPVAQSSLKVDGVSSKGIKGWNVGFTWDLNKQFSMVGSWNSGKGGCPVTGTKKLGLDWHPCSHLGARVTYDRTTLGFLTNIGKLVHPYLSASLCLESDIHGRSSEQAEAPHRFGAKLTFSH